MTTIKSVSEAAALSVDPYRDGTTDVAASRGTREVFHGIFKTADLLAALDATANTDVAKLHFEEVGEQDYRAGSPYRYKIAYEHWRRLAQERKTAADERAEWKARAEKAEASLDAAREIIARVRALLVFGTIEGDELRTALDPKPAFILPTEAGAGIRCTGPTESGLSYFTEMRLFSDGRWRDSEGCAWDAETVLDTFWDFRLIGAES